MKQDKKFECFHFFTTCVNVISSNFFYVSFIFLVNLTAFIFGVVIGFTGPNLELFKSDKTPLTSGKITLDEESWIGSLTAFGAIGFTLVYGFVSEKFGRKPAILMIGVPQTVSELVSLISSQPDNFLFRPAGSSWLLPPTSITFISQEFFQAWRELAFSTSFRFILQKSPIKKFAASFALRSL